MFLEMFEDEFAHEKVSPSLSPPSLSQMHKILIQQCTTSVLTVSILMFFILSKFSFLP